MAEVVVQMQGKYGRLEMIISGDMKITSVEVTVDLYFHCEWVQGRLMRSVNMEHGRLGCQDELNRESVENKHEINEISTQPNYSLMLPYLGSRCTRVGDLECKCTSTKTGFDILGKTFGFVVTWL